MIIDTHCHYNAEPILGNIEKYWQESLDNNVVGGVCIGTDIKNSQIALDLSSQFPSMFASIAIHPEEYTDKIKHLINHETHSDKSVGETVAEDIKNFEKLLKSEIEKNESKLVAVGEIGLDYYRLKAKGLKRDLAESIQKQIFTKQLELAFKNNLPVILHVRDQADRKEKNAYYDVYKIVSELVTQYNSENMAVPPIILHCASGPKDYINNFLDLGAYLGFAGNITYDNAPELREILKMTPKNKVLLETDAPYLAPLEKKGQICNPYFITDTGKFLQDKYQIDLDIIVANTLKVFPQFQKVVELNHGK